MTATELLVATITVDEALAQKGASWLAGSGSPYVGVDAIDLPDSVLDQVFALYKASYARLPSEPPGTPTFNIQDARALLEYDRFVLITASDSTIVGFVLAKTTAHGAKICATGQNGSREARAAILAFHIDALNTADVYAEVSPPLETKIDGKVPDVSSADAKTILEGKTLVTDDDGIHYKRRISNIGERTKKMVGKPRLIVAKSTARRRRP